MERSRRQTRILEALREAIGIAERRRRLVRAALLGLGGLLLVAAASVLLAVVW